LHALYRSRKINSSTYRTRIRRIILFISSVGKSIVHVFKICMCWHTSHAFYFLLPLTFLSFTFLFDLRTLRDARSFMQKDKREGDRFGRRIFLVSIEEHGARGGRHVTYIYTHVRAHTYTHVHKKTYGLRLGSAIVFVFMSLSLFFLIFWKSRCRTWASTAPSSDLHSRFGRSTKRSLSFSVSIYQAPILARQKWNKVTKCEQ